MIENLPLIGLGTNSLKTFAEIKTMMTAMLKNNYEHINTAEVYNNEFFIGALLKNGELNENDLFITTKVFLWNYKNVEKTVKASMKRLGLEKINLVQLHWPAPRKYKKLQIDAYLELVKLRQKGLIQHIGVCNFNVEDLKELYKTTNEHPYCNQFLVTPKIRSDELEAYCGKHNIKKIALSVYELFNNPDPKKPLSLTTKEEVEYIDQLANKYQKTREQILLRWAIQKGFHLVITIKRKEEMSLYKDIFNITLCDEEVYRINLMNNYSSEQYDNLWHNLNKISSVRFKKVLSHGLSFKETMNSKQVRMVERFIRKFKQ